jgi:cbb3-type cytochrome oxidase maturation protein
MSVLYVVVPLALLAAAGWVLAFAWAVKGGQMDDLDTPGARMLHDEPPRERGRD